MFQGTPDERSVFIKHIQYHSLQLKVHTDKKIPLMNRRNGSIIMDSDSSTIRAMLQQEESGYSMDKQKASNNFVSPFHGGNNHHGSSNNTNVNLENRKKMIEWYHQIAEFCNFNNETVEIATSYLDRFVILNNNNNNDGPSSKSKVDLVDQGNFQLVAMTAFYTAVKIYENEVMDPALLSSLSQGAYSANQFEVMEYKILSTLKWRVNPPTSLAFARELINIVPTNLITTTNRHNTNNNQIEDLPKAIENTVFELSKLQTELSIGDNRLRTVNKSMIAFASFINALESVSCLDKQCIARVGDYLSKITSIDWCTKQFMDAQYLLYTNLNENMGQDNITMMADDNSNLTKTSASSQSQNINSNSNDRMEIDTEKTSDSRGSPRSVHAHRA